MSIGFLQTTLGIEKISFYQEGAGDIVMQTFAIVEFSSFSLLVSLLHPFPPDSQALPNMFWGRAAPTSIIKFDLLSSGSTLQIVEL